MRLSTSTTVACFLAVFTVACGDKSQKKSETPAATEEVATDEEASTVLVFQPTEIDEKTGEEVKIDMPVIKTYNGVIPKDATEEEMAQIFLNADEQKIEDKEVSLDDDFKGVEGSSEQKAFYCPKSQNYNRSCRSNSCGSYAPRLVIPRVACTTCGYFPKTVKWFQQVYRKARSFSMNFSYNSNSMYSSNNQYLGRYQPQAFVPQILPRMPSQCGTYSHTSWSTCRNTYANRNPYQRGRIETYNGGRYQPYNHQNYGQYNGRYN